MKSIAITLLVVLAVEVMVLVALLVGWIAPAAALPSSGAKADIKTGSKYSGSAEVTILGVPVAPIGQVTVTITMKSVSRDGTSGTMVLDVDSKVGKVNPAKDPSATCAWRRDPSTNHVFIDDKKCAIYRYVGSLGIFYNPSADDIELRFKPLLPTWISALSFLVGTMTPTLSRLMPQ